MTFQFVMTVEYSSLYLVTINRGGRPEVSFICASAPSKRRMKRYLHDNTTNDELYAVVKKKMLSDGNRKGAKLIDMIADQNNVDQMSLSVMEPLSLSLSL